MFSSNTPTGPATKPTFQFNKDNSQVQKQLKGPENMNGNFFNTGGQSQSQQNSVKLNEDLLNKKKPVVPAFNQSGNKQQSPTMQSFTTFPQGNKGSPQKQSFLSQGSNLPKVEHAGKFGTLGKDESVRGGSDEYHMSQKYNHSYVQKSHYDILNNFYQMNERPNEVDGDIIKDQSLILVNLLKPQINEKEDIVGLINFNQIRQLQEPNLTKVKQFWCKIVLNFIKLHPYCSIQGVISLAHFHIKQNAEIYYSKGQFNIELFHQNGLLSDSISPQSSFFSNILNQIESLATLFVNQFLATINAIPQKLGAKFLNTYEIINNIWGSFESLYSFDRGYRQGNVHEQIGYNLVLALYKIHNKNPKLFEIVKGGERTPDTRVAQPNFIFRCFRFVDEHISEITRNTSLKNYVQIEKTLCGSLTFKIIQLLNELSFNFPYNVDNWDTKYIESVSYLKSSWLYPFKWLSLQVNSSAFATAGSYFVVAGKEWILFLKACIRIERKSKSHTNQHLKDLIFFLLCSIIEQNPTIFWTDSFYFQEFHEYIRQVYYGIESSGHRESSRNNFGKMCRLMICACGKPTLKYSELDVSPEVLSSFYKDSILLRSAIHQKNGEGQFSFGNLVYHNFITNIIGEGEDRRNNFFRETVMTFLLIENQAVQFPLFSNLNEIDPIIVKYHSEANASYELLQRLIIDSPQLLLNLSEFFMQFIQERSEQENSQLGSLQRYVHSFIYKITFEYIIKIEEYCFGKAKNSSQMIPDNLSKSIEQAQVIPFALQVLNKLALNEHTKVYVMTLLNQYYITEDNRLRQLFERSMHFERNLNALCKHVEILYGQGYGEIRWVVEICIPIIESFLVKHEKTVIRHMANIARLALVKRCQISTRTPFLNNLLQLSPLQNGSRIQNLHDVRVPELSKNVNYLLEYIKWALRVEQDSLRVEYFYNSLYVKKDYENLEAALKLLQILAVVNYKFSNQIYVSQKISRFLLVNAPQKQILRSSSYGSESISISEQIEISNKKSVTLPGALAYLISSPSLISPSNFRQHNSAKAKQIRSLALNILNLLMSKNTYEISRLGQENQIKQTDSILNIDFNVYQQSFIGQHQQIYCECRGVFMNYVSKTIENENVQYQLDALSWYQNSVIYGQILDILPHISKLFYSESVIHSIENRIQPLLLNYDELTNDMRRNMDQSVRYMMIHPSQFKLKQIPRYLVSYLSDKQICGYCRYVVNFVKQFSCGDQGGFRNVIKIMEVVGNRLMALINQQVYSKFKADIVEEISSNFWQIFKVLQKKQNLKLFKTAIQNFIPFILDPYHLSLTNPNYVKQYLLSFKLILACKDYLPENLLRQFLQTQKLGLMLLKLARKCAQKLPYYTILFSCLNMYKRLSEYIPDSSYEQQLLSIAKLVNETANPLEVLKNRNSYETISTPKIEQLSMDVTLISILTFLNTNLPNNSNLKELQNLLLISNTNSQSLSFNYKSLLLNSPLEMNSKNLKNALSIGYNSINWIQLVSVCNYLYTVVEEKGVYMADEGTVHIFEILKFIESIFGFEGHHIDKNIDKKEGLKIFSYLKSWGCSLLHIILANMSSKNIGSQIAQILLHDTRMLSLFGELLTNYNQMEIKWAFKTQQIFHETQLGLQQKVLLFSCVKIYNGLVAQKQYWNLKQLPKSSKQNFNSMCKSIVSASGLLNKISGRQNNSRDDYAFTNSAYTAYEEILSQVSIEHLYAPFLSSSSSQAQSSQVLERSKLKQLHPNCSNALDILHDHFNLLISQRYLMLLYACYRNQELFLDSYEPNEIFNIFESVTKRLIEINQHERPYMKVMNKIENEIWYNQRLSLDLYYLNEIQIPPSNSIEVLNWIAELSLKCVIVLKQSLEMHRDYRDFVTKTDKMMKLAKKQQTSNVFKFDVSDYVQRAGYDNRSQLGTSKINPSTYRLSK